MARKVRKSGGVAVTAAAAEVREAVPLQNLRIDRRRQHTLELTLDRDVTRVDARAVVLGVFPDVAPTGPAKALDEKLGHAITEFTQRRMFGGNVGETFLMPVSRSSLRCELILFAGMGAYDRFNADVQQLVAENVVRIFVRTRVEEFATVLVGSGSGHSVSETVRNMARGFVRGLLDADRARRFRRIILCEYDPVRYEEMKAAVFELAKTPLFDEIELILDEAKEEAPRAVAAPPPGKPRAAKAPAPAKKPAAPRLPTYLFVRELQPRGKKSGYHCSVLGGGGPAAIPSDEKWFDRAALDELLSEIDDDGGFGFAGLPAFGRKLGELVLPEAIRAAILKAQPAPLVLVHDAPASRVPWETIHFGRVAPALEAGLTRRYTAEDLSIAKWLEERRRDKTIDILLVTNPTGDLVGADKERERLRAAFGATSAVKITELNRAEATRRRILDAIRSGKHDVLHYAGHAAFDERSPDRSGILCHGHERLTGADLASIGNLPCLVFFNACEAARIRKARPTPRRVERVVSFAESFLRGGVANFVGTYWPVGDAGAETFASRFYAVLLGGKSIAEALLAGREALHAKRLVDWADYVFYGSPDFLLKDAASAESRNGR